MISYINGIVKHQSDQSITVEIGPVGLTIQVPDGTAFRVGESSMVQLYMHWNADQGPSFYGFTSSLEKTAFILITSCSGIGPKIGLAILSDLGEENFLQAVQLGDDKALSKVSGIGARKAEQVIMQLRGKVGKLIDSGLQIGDAKKVEQWHTISQALESLSYSRAEVTQAMGHLKNLAEKKEYSFDQLMRQALSFLSKQS